jgi:hypothetical protein
MDKITSGRLPLEIRVDSWLSVKNDCRTSREYTASGTVIISMSIIGLREAELPGAL